MHDDCEGRSRRDFLKGGVVAALAVFGPVRLLEAAARTGSDVSYPIPAADGANIDRANQVILVRWSNSIYAFALSCPHQRTALRWRENDARFQCPKHKSKYQPDGSFISGRATRGMDRYAVRRDGSMVIVDTATLYRQDRNPAGWNAAFIRVENEK